MPILLLKMYQLATVSCSHYSVTYLLLCLLSILSQQMLFFCVISMPDFDICAVILSTLRGNHEISRCVLSNYARWEDLFIYLFACASQIPCLCTWQNLQDFTGRSRKITHLSHHGVIRSVVMWHLHVSLNQTVIFFTELFLMSLSSQKCSVLEWPGRRFK